MAKRLRQFLSAALLIPLWQAIAVVFGVWVGLIVLADPGASAGVNDAASALPLLWLAAIAVYFPFRICRFYSRREVPILEVLVTVGAFHLLALAALLWGPLNHQTFGNYAAELMGFDRPVLIAIFLSMWAFASFLIALRYEKLRRFDATRTRLACAIGICGVLLLYAIGAQSVVSGFGSYYRSFGADLPGPTLLLLAIYPYWYAIPLLGAVMAGGSLIVSDSQVRVRRGAFDGLIGLFVMTNLAMVAGLMAMLLPATHMCSGILEDGFFPSRVETGFTRLHAAASLGREESVLRLIARGEPVNARDTSGFTPLLIAISQGHEKTARSLLANGAEVNAANEYGYTPLQAAVSAAGRSGSSLELVELLLEGGAQVNAARKNSGQTPLHYATYADRMDVAALLLAKGADVNALAVDGTPLDRAYEYKHDQLAKLLLQHGAVRATKQEREAKQAGNQVRTVPSGRSCG